MAPTFLYPYNEKSEEFDFGRPNWRDSLREVGGAFGREERAEEFISEYEARAAEMRNRLAERWSDATFAAMEPVSDQATMYIYGKVDFLVHQILFEDLGLTPASFLTPANQQLSLEAVPEIDADVLFIGLYVSPKNPSEPDREAFTSFTNSELWRQIPAVRQDQVYEFEGDISYTSPLTATAYLDLVEENLLA